jgi:RNA recognition motif. (a.k.a. RRM, RBD, or RNP domain)
MSAERRDSNHRTNTDADTTLHELQRQVSHGDSPYRPQLHPASPTAAPTMMAMQIENHQSPSQAQLLAQQSQAYGVINAATSLADAGTGSTTLAVTNLPYRIRWQDLKDLFRRYGTPSRADVFLAPDGRSRGVGMVSMRTRREAENCVNDLNGYEWYGRKIGVKIDETGGHHALAAAAMAGATIWEGVGFTQQSSVPATDTYEVTPFTRITFYLHTLHFSRFLLFLYLAPPA